MYRQDVAPETGTVAPPSTALHGRRDELERIGHLLRGARGPRAPSWSSAARRGSASRRCSRRHAPPPRTCACSPARHRVRGQLPYAGLHQLLRPVLGDADGDPAAAGARAARRARARGRRERRVVPRLARRAQPARRGGRAAAAAVPGRRRALARRGVGRVASLRRAAAGGRARRDAVRRPRGRRRPRGARVEELRRRRARRARPRTRSSIAPAAGARARGAERLVGATGGNPLALLELSAALTEEQAAGASRSSARCRSARASSARSSSACARLPPATQTLLLVAAADERGELRRCSRRGAAGGAAEALDAAEQAGLIRVRGRAARVPPPADALGRLPRRAAVAAPGRPPRARGRARRRDESRPARLAPRRRERRARRRGRRRARAARRGARGRSGFVAASLAYERAAALAADERRRARLLTAAAENAWFAGRSARAGRCCRARAPSRRARPSAPTSTRLRGLIEMTCGVPADASQLAVRRAATSRPATPSAPSTCCASPAGGAAYAATATRSSPIAARAERLRVRTRLPTASCSRAWPAWARSSRATSTPPPSGSARARARRRGSAADELPDRLGARQPGRPLPRRRRRGARPAPARRRARTRGRDDRPAHPGAAAARAGRDLGRPLAVGRGRGSRKGSSSPAARPAPDRRPHHRRCRRCSPRCAARRSVPRARRREPRAGVARGAGPRRALRHVGARGARAGPRPPARRRSRTRASCADGGRSTGARWTGSRRPCAPARPRRPGVARGLRAVGAEQPRAVGAGGRPALPRAAVRGRPRPSALFAAALALHERARAARSSARAPSSRSASSCAARAAAPGRATTCAPRSTASRRSAPALWAERARSELRASGQTARRRDASTLDQLTAQELQIAQLVAEGLTNRDVAAQLFLSPRTIDFHLRNVFRKLGITSRMELARVDLAQGSPS